MQVIKYLVIKYRIVYIYKGSPFPDNGTLALRAKMYEEARLMREERIPLNGNKQNAISKTENSFSNSGSEEGSELLNNVSIMMSK